jgi:hypothetical protein
MISPNLHEIWVVFFLNLSQELKLVLLLYFGNLGDGYSLKGSKKKPSRHNFSQIINLIIMLGQTSGLLGVIGMKGLRQISCNCCMWTAAISKYFTVMWIGIQHWIQQPN